VPVSLQIITGILGAGKTTVVQHLLDATRIERTAVVVGEFAEVGFDAMLLAQTQATVRQIAATGIGGATKSYAGAVRELVETGDFDRVLIETSGVAEIDKVVGSLMGDPSIRARTRLGNTVTVLDAGAFQVHDTYFAAQLWAQVDVADVVIVNKTDRAAQLSLSEIRRRIRERNDEAQVVFTYMGQVRRGDVLDPRYPEYTARATRISWPQGPPADFESFVYRSEAPCHDRMVFGHRLLNLPMGMVARFKGVLRGWDRSYCINGFPGQLDWDTAPVEGKTAIAIIGLELASQKDAICALLDKELAGVVPVET
jgi:G3E family GTPase